MRICRTIIKNYRNLKNTDVELSEIVSLIGANNSGKSNFLCALSIPLSADDNPSGKKLSWYDINRETKDKYYEFLNDNKQRIINKTITVQEFTAVIPYVEITLYFLPDENEHYDIKDILVSESPWIGGIKYIFRVKNPEQLLDRVQCILNSGDGEIKNRMSLLPMDLFDYSITVPERENNISYETLTGFRTVSLPAERDNFASSADKLGSKALSGLLQKHLTPEAEDKIEKAYASFFETVKAESNLDTIMNWQDYTDIPNAQAFFEQISILPNMPQMSSILNNIKLGYQDDYMFAQGLGHRNLVLMTVILHSYLSQERDISYRLMTVEEPETHLCCSNVLLMVSLFNLFSKKTKYTQIVYSTHNVELVNKIGLDKVILFHNGEAFSLNKALSPKERDYLVANPNTDIFKVLYSKKVILVEGITEEILIKSYLQTRNDLNDIKVLSFHKGFIKIIDIWKKLNSHTENKLGVVRDFDDEPKPQAEHESRQDEHVIVRTTSGYTLETDLTKANFELLKKEYGDIYGWSNMTEEQLQADWRTKKSDVILRICHDLVNGSITGFSLPPHIQEIIDFMQEDTSGD